MGRKSSEYKSQDWKGLNNAPKELNSDFADCIDYCSLAHRMLDYLKNEAKYQNVKFYSVVMLDSRLNRQKY